MKARLAELERLLSRAVGNESAEFQCEVMHWLMRQEEYRRFARELFERIGDAEDPQLSLLISAQEWGCLGEWIERAESSVRTGIKAAS
jgi:hypothetical protein